MRQKFPNTSLKAYKPKVEGDFFDKNKDVPDESKLKLGVYPSHQEAERMVGIIGIRNAQLGYFKGKTHLMGR